jgi:hypothetical protein
VPEKEENPVRFVGLDVHKHHLVATAVDVDKNEVMPMRRVPLVLLDDWVRKNLTLQDAVYVCQATFGISFIVGQRSPPSDDGQGHHPLLDTDRLPAVFPGGTAGDGPKPRAHLR